MPVYLHGLKLNILSIKTLLTTIRFLYNIWQTSNELIGLKET